MINRTQRALALLCAMLLLISGFAGAIGMAETQKEHPPIPLSGRMLGIGADAVQWIQTGFPKAPTKIKKITITKPKKALRIGEKPKLSVKISYSGKKPAMSRFVAEYSAPDILAVTYEKKAFYVQPLALGNTTLTIKDSLGTKEGSALLTVSAFAPQSVVLDQTTLTLQKGKSQQLVGSVLPASANQKLTWKSSKTSVAKVSKTGVVKAVKKGKATITATSDNGKKITCVVTVQNDPVPTPTPTQNPGETPAPTQTPGTTPAPTSTPPPTGKGIKKIGMGGSPQVLMEDGTLFYLETQGGVQKNPGTGYTDIATGVNDAIALKGDQLFDVGWGRQELIGTGFTAISTGYNYSLALKGTDLYAWGENEHGKLGDGTKIDRPTPVKVGEGFTHVAAGDDISLAIKGGELYQWGKDGPSIPTKVNAGVGFTGIATGGYSNAALKGTDLYEWEGNEGASMRKTNSGIASVSVGGSHILALKGDGLYVKGYGDFDLGLGSSVDSADDWTLIGTGYTHASAGWGRSFAVKNGEVYVWGDGYNGALGLPTPAVVYVPTKINLPK